MFTESNVGHSKFPLLSYNRKTNLLNFSFHHKNLVKITFQVKFHQKHSKWLSLTWYLVGSFKPIEIVPNYNLWQNQLEQNLKITPLYCRNFVNFYALKFPYWGLQGWSLLQCMIPPPLSQCWCPPVTEKQNLVLQYCTGGAGAVIS